MNNDHLIGKKVIINKEQLRLDGPKYPGRTGIINRISACDNNLLYIDLEATSRAGARTETFWLGELILQEEDHANETERDRESFLREDFEKLRAFAQDVMNVWFEGDLIGDPLQELAAKHGLLRLEIRHEDCSVEGVSLCQCIEYCSQEEFKEGVECFRKTPLLQGEKKHEKQIN